MRRLSAATASLRYDRAAASAGVVHLGLGAFHRAHQAPVFDALLDAGDTRWGIAAVAMRSRELARTLGGQDGLYSLAERGAAPLEPRVIGSILRTIVAADDPAGTVALLARPETHLVTLTVTEKGYPLPEGDVGATPPGLLAAALDLRRHAGRAPLTVMSCDNRSGNGAAARAAVLAAAERLALPDAARDWIAREVAFPATMVDRITPAPTAAMVARSSAALGLDDRAAVWTEPFWQWVAEDIFAAARPDLAAHGVQLVGDVAPWEDAKLRLLNAAHSALAYGGLLAGHDHVHQAIADPRLRVLIENLWDEAATTLGRGPLDIAGYRRALLARFANPALPHALRQIAADGSQKIPSRLLTTIGMRTPAASPAAAQAVGAWIAALASGLPLADPLIDTLRPLARAGDVVALLVAIGVDPAFAPPIAARLQPDAAHATVRS